jgi:hypothetical protein
MARRARRPQPKPAAPPAAPVDLVQAVVEAIARGELDQELAVLGAVINQRLRLLATARSMTALAACGSATGCGSTTAPSPTT